MNKQDGFDMFYNEFKDWNKKGILHRTYNIILENADKDRQLEHLQNLIAKTTDYYLKTLAKNKTMPDEAVEMFNLLEGNIND